MSDAKHITGTLFRRLVLGAALGAAALTMTVMATPAQAQIAGAIGKPLPSPDLPAGSIVVKAIAGSPRNALVDVDVTLVVNGEPRVVKTDAAGHAKFEDLPAGASVIAKVTDSEGNSTQSDEFTVSGDSGERVMISTKPFEPVQGGGGGAPFAPFAGGGGGAQGMPEPRQMSGQPRPEEKNAPGVVTVLVCYDDFKDPAVDATVSLVGYRWDGQISHTSAKTDKSGHVTFEELDRSGGTAYYAMTQLMRNDTTDRLVSAPIQLDGQVGTALLLSSDKRGAKTPPIDEQERFNRQEDTPAGKVRVVLRGRVVGSNQVELVDAATTKVIGHTLPVRAEPDVGNVEPQAQFDDKPNEPAGTFDITLRGGANDANQPMLGLEVAMAPAGKAGGEPVIVKTDNEGTAHFVLPPGSYTAQVMLAGKPMSSPPIDLTKHGAALQVEAHWQTVERLQAIFDVAPQPGQALYARMLGPNGSEDVFRSPPFMAVPERGTVTAIIVGPHVLLQFNMVSEVEDNLLAVQGQWSLENLTWAPYRASPDGLVIQLPKHFKGALVADRDAQVAAVDQAEGFRIMKPIAPQRTEFHGFFSLPIDGGDLAWNMDLPFGAFQSDLRIVSFPTMRVELPGNAKGETFNARDGTPIYDIRDISIEPGHSMAMVIHGLPSIAAWRIWAPRIVGVLVVLLIVGGITLALTMGAKAAPAVDPSRAARRTRLMDELVELDKAGGKDKKRRDAVVSELEKLWD